MSVFANERVFRAHWRNPWKPVSSSLASFAQSVLKHTVVDYEPLVMSQSALMPHLNIDQLFFPPPQTPSFLSLREHVERPTKLFFSRKLKIKKKKILGGGEGGH